MLERTYAPSVEGGTKPSQVMLSDRKLEVQRRRACARAGRPKWRPTPPCKTAEMGARVLEILVSGFSTRNYKEVMAAEPARP